MLVIASSVSLAMLSHVVRPKEHLDAERWPVSDEQGYYKAYKVRNKGGLYITAEERLLM